MRLLIVGGDSQIGKFLKLKLNNKYEIYSTTRNINMKSSKNLYLNLYDVKKSINFLPKVDVVLLLASVNNFEYCEKNPEILIKINLEATYELIKKFTMDGSNIIFISTASVFNSDFENNETANVIPPTYLYPRSKYIIEQILKTYNLARTNSNTIIRLSKLITLDSKLIRNWINCAVNNQDIICYDRVFSPISLNYTLDCMSKIIASNIAGTFHITGASLINYKKFAFDFFSKNYKNKLPLNFIEKEYKDFQTGSILKMTETSKIFKIYPQEYSNFIETLS